VNRGLSASPRKILRFERVKGHNLGDEALPIQVFVSLIRYAAESSLPLRACI